MGREGKGKGSRLTPLLQVWMVDGCCYCVRTVIRIAFSSESVPVDTREEKIIHFRHFTDGPDFSQIFESSHGILCGTLRLTRD